MKLMRYWAVPALALTVTVGACDSGLTDVNVNPNEPEAVPPQNLLANAILESVGGALPNPRAYGTHGVWAGLYLTNLWSQHLAAPVYNTEDRYQPRSAQLTGIWDETYTGPLTDLLVIKQEAEETGDNNLFAVAEIMTQYNFQFLTDMFGDIPYSQALRAPDVSAPAYDTQQEVYAGMLTAMADAVTRINRSATSPVWAEGDVFFGGNMERWFRFANSLRMRMAMRIAEVDQTIARDHFVAAYNAGGMQSNADNALLQWSSAVPNQNPIYDQFFNQARRDQSMSAALIDRLKAWDDPRLPIFAAPSVADGEFRGLPNGLTPAEIAVTEPELSWLGTEFLRSDAPSIVLTYAEVLFLQAEAVERGWIQGNAAQLYQQGIRASMEQFGVGASAINAYLGQADVAYDGIPSIATQKWVALFLNGPEAWSEQRRTGYPELTPAVGDAIPSRLPYPTTEQQYNPSNARTSSMFTRMWWMGN